MKNYDDVDRESSEADALLAAFRKLAEYDQLIDDETGPEYQAQPLAQDWARAGKVIEELGEVITNLIGYTAQNHRKGRYSSQREMLEEMADVLITSLLGIQHFTKNRADTAALVMARWEYRLRKANL